MAPRGPDKSTTFDRVLMAFSNIGSTWWRIPNLLSKSWIYGIILESDCIFEKTFISGYVSSSRVNILLVSAFYMLFTAFFLATAAATAGFYFASSYPIVLFNASMRF